MKIMVASDLHGSIYFGNLMAEAYTREKCDRLLLLGDLLYHGPRNDLPKGYDPKKVIKLLNEMKNDILCVRGNCEAEVDQMVLDFPIMAEYCILHMGNRMIFATHGHNFNKERLPSLKTGDILLHGHTHVPICEEFGGVTGKDFIYMNPGSVSIPKGDSQNSYLTIDDEEVLWKNMNGEVFMHYSFK